MLFTNTSTQTTKDSNTNLIDINDFNINNIEFKDIKVFITNITTNNELITNKKLDKLVSFIDNVKENSRNHKVFNIRENIKYNTNIVINCAIIRHIVTDKSYFYSFFPYNKRVN